MQNRLETELMKQKTKEKHGPFKDKNEKMQREKALERSTHSGAADFLEARAHSREGRGHQELKEAWGQWGIWERLQEEVLFHHEINLFLMMRMSALLLLKYSKSESESRKTKTARKCFGGSDEAPYPVCLQVAQRSAVMPVSPCQHAESSPALL